MKKTFLTNMKKDRHIKAIVVLEIEFLIDKETDPEDVLHNQGLTIDSDHGRIFNKKLIHSSIIKEKKIK